MDICLVEWAISFLPSGLVPPIADLFLFWGVVKHSFIMVLTKFKTFFNIKWNADSIRVLKGDRKYISHFYLQLNYQ